jgi:hypothetical protein
MVSSSIILTTISRNDVRGRHLARGAEFGTVTADRHIGRFLGGQRRLHYNMILPV